MRGHLIKLRTLHNLTTTTISMLCPSSRCYQAQKAHRKTPPGSRLASCWCACGVLAPAAAQLAALTMNVRQWAALIGAVWPIEVQD
eukprot:1047260-Pelagomonas_calceolata.AAC.3